MAKPKHSDDHVEIPYELANDEHLTARTTVGMGQFGTIIYRIDGVTVASGNDRLLATLGTGAQLRNRKIQIVSVVVDTNPQHNRATVAYELSGGSEGVTEHRGPLEFEQTNGVLVFTADVLV